MSQLLSWAVALFVLVAALNPTPSFAQDAEPEASPAGALPPEVAQPGFDVFRVATGGTGRAYRVWEEWVPQVVNTPDGGAWVFFTAQAREDEGYGTRRLFASRFDPTLAIWSPAEAIGKETTQFGATAAVDSKGAIHLVYSERQMDTEEAWSQLVYQRLDGTDWSAPEAIAPHPDAGHQMLPSLAIGRDDDLHLIWRDQRLVSAEQRLALPTNADLFSSDLVDGKWSDPVQVNVREAADVNPAWPHLAIDGDRLVVVWSIYEGSTAEEMRSAARVEWSVRARGGGDWSAPQVLFRRESGDAGGRLIDLASDPTGGVVVVYGLYDKSVNQLYLQRLSPGAEAWSEPLLLTSGDYGYLPVAAIDPEGFVYIVFNSGRNRDVDIGGLKVAPDGSHEIAVSLTPGEGGITARASIALDHNGVPWVVYMHQPTGASNVTEIQGVRAARFTPPPAP